MRSVYVNLSTPQTVQQFVEKIAPLKGSFDLVSGNYILDARSLMGIFTLDLSAPIRLDVGEDTAENMQAIEEFIVDEK